MPKTIYSVQIKDNCTLVHDENGYYHLVYKIVNTVNGKIYIGKHSTKNPYDDYMGSGIAINSAIEKYGIENFSKEILFCFTDEKEAYLKESEIVDENFVKRSDTYNMMCGGEGSKSCDVSGEKNPWYGKHLPQETKDKLSKALKGKFVGEKNPWYGKHLPQETKDKISKARKGKCVGEKNPMYGRCGEKNPMYGKHPHRSKETREKMSRAKSGKNNSRAKHILKIDASENIVAEYGCIKECREQEHIGKRKLSKILKEHILYNGFYFVIETSKRLF